MKALKERIDSHVGNDGKRASEVLNSRDGYRTKYRRLKVVIPTRSNSILFSADFTVKKVYSQSTFFLSASLICQLFLPVEAAISKFMP